jgi:GNAT superfamily N-acetyltransferase
VGAGHLEVHRGDYTISTDPGRLHLPAVHGYLTRSYWAEGIAEEVVRRSVEHSLCFGLYRGAEQVGFARVVTDRATFAYLCDVYVLEGRRGRGLGRWLMETVLAHPDLQGLRRFLLITRDAHGLYRPLGFREPANPSGYLEIHRPNLYRGGDRAACPAPPPEGLP